MSNYQLGLVSVSFRGHSPEEIVKATAAAGLDVIEWGSDVHAPCRDADRLKEIVRLQDMYGISCCSYGTYFRLGQTSLAELPDYMHAASMLGTRVLRLWCGTKSGDVMTKEERVYLLGQCKAAAEMAEREGMVLCMECHRGTFTQHAQDAVELMQAVNSAYFRMYWQPFQWLDETENLAIAKMLAPYVRNVHVFNWKGDQRFPLSDSLHTWRRYLEALPKSCALLLEFMPDDRMESLPAQARALRDIIGENV